MRFASFLLPWDRWPALDSIAEVAQAAERVGFHSVVLGEHFVTPLTGQAHPIGKTWPEIYVLSSYLAATTERLHFIFNATVVPYRHPIHQAAEIATLDQLSKGRLTVVTGIGWLEEEFAALGVPFANRGARTEEYVRAMRALWTQDEAEFHGTYVSFDKVAVEPKCYRKPHVRLLVGGIGRHARRRIAEYGDGWGAPIPWPMDKVAREIVRIKEQVAEAGRDPESLYFTAGLSYGDPDPLLAEAFAHVGSIGTMPAAPSVEELLDTIGQYREMGVHELVTSTRWDTPQHLSERLEWFADRVLSEAGAP